jgi:hypothetical protein
MRICLRGERHIWDADLSARRNLQADRRRIEQDSRYADEAIGRYLQISARAGQSSSERF